MKKGKSIPRVIVEEVASEPAAPAVSGEQPAISTPLSLSSTSSPSSFSFFWVIVPGIVLLGLLMGGIIAYFSGLQKLNPAESNQKVSISEVFPSPTLNPLPSASPKAQIDLTQYKIKILNGSGIKGEAGKAKDLLEQAGFVVEAVGNAKTYDYQKTIIQAKAAVEESFLTKLSESLAKTYEMGKNETLKDSEDSAVIVIIGSSKVE